MAKKEKPSATERYTRGILQAMVPPIDVELNLLDVLANVARMSGIIMRAIPKGARRSLILEMLNTLIEEALRHPETKPKSSAPRRKANRRAAKKKGANKGP